MNGPILRWGILGAANIARKNWQAIWNSGNGVVSAVASREIERGRRFIDECQAQAAFPTAPHALGSYEELLADPGINAVYIPLPTAARKAWVLRAAAAGKHVICEKPCAIGVTDLEEMLEACRRQHVQFMDGVMFMHSRRFDRIREVLDDGETIGPLRRIASAFTWPQPDAFFATNIRARSELEPEGCLGDLGWYCIRFALWAMRWQLPRAVAGRVLSEFKHPGSPRAVPTEFAGELFFDGGVSSPFYCSFTTALEQTAHLSGTRGYLRVPDFVLPFRGSQMSFETGSTEFTVQGCDFTLEPHPRSWPVDEPSNSHPDAQESNLFRHFAEQVRSGTLNEDWPRMALQTQRVMQACRESARAQGRIVEDL